MNHTAIAELCLARLCSGFHGEAERQGQMYLTSLSHCLLSFTLMLLLTFAFQRAETNIFFPQKFPFNHSPWPLFAHSYVV